MLKKKYLYIVCTAILGLIATVAVIFFATHQLGKKNLEKDITIEAENAGTEIGKSTYETIMYQGQEYVYRDNIINILCMGVDKEEQMSERNDGDSSVGQADAIFLLSMDLDKKEIRVIAVPRDTMVTLQMYNGAGTYMGEREGQITLQYAYGDGQSLSAMLMAQQVSGLLNDIPINAYLAVNVRCLWKINDAIGGVDITMDDDYTEFNPLFEKGATVHLAGSNLENYIRGRDKTEVDGAYMRMHRMKQYMLAFFEKAKTVVKEDMTLPLQVMEELKNDMETDVTAEKAVYLLTEALKCSFLEANMYTLSGENYLIDGYVEYHLNEEAVMELVLDLFYEEKQNNPLAFWK